MDVTGKVAVVTGAASGIGLGIATSLAQSGAKVMLCDIEKPALDRALDTLRATNADVDGAVADVSLKAELQAAADATLDRFGAVHILVSNAGVGGGASYGAWSDKSWDWTLGVNLMSVIWGFELFGPLIERHGEGGHIVNTASMAGLVPATNPAYTVTKYGVVALSENLRPVLAERGIGVSVLCPGFIRTNIMASSRNIPDRLDGAQDTMPETGQAAAFMKMAEAAIANGIDPNYVGDLVLEAIEQDWPYIFTDTEFEPAVDERFAEIKAGFDRIRDREPVR